MSYLGDVLSSAFSIIFFIAIIAALGYLVGGISIKGISLGTAGVLLGRVALRRARKLCTLI